MNERELMQEGLESIGIYYGIYKGFVADNKDPEKKGRVKVTCPEIFGEDTHDYWALPKGNYAGKGIGIEFIPEEGDAIWVSFEKGDSRFPVWEGGWWVEEAPSGDPNIKRIKTKSGTQITFDDSKTSLNLLQGDGKIDMTPDEITVDFKGKKVTINNKGVSVISDKISLGKLDVSKYKAVEGETLKGLLEEALTAIASLTVATSFGPSSVPINAAVFNSIKAKLDTMLSSTVTLE